MVNSPLHRLWSIFLLSLCLVGLARASALEDYIAADDGAFGYRLVGQVPGPGFTAHLLNLDSQRWRSDAEVTPTLWNHWMTVIVPDTRLTTSAHLFLFGGSTRGTPPAASEIAVYAQIAMATGAVLVALEQVPGQPLQFVDEPAPLREDALVAYSWRKLMRTGDPNWAAYLPMTKAAVKAMDAAQDYAAGSLGVPVTDFIVTGASKRGATAWLTAAVDDRVLAVAPLVFNALNLADEIEREFEAYGDYPEAVSDYVERGVLQNLRSPEGRLLESIVDPINYRQALNMPHYVINAGGDEFFRPDASLRYGPQIPGELLQRVVPNAGHGLEEQFGEVLLGLTAWYQSVILGAPRPQIDWSLSDGVLSVTSDQPPAAAVLWRAHNPTTPDFRLDVFGPGWLPTPLSPDADGVVRAPTPSPDQGYSAYLVELVYPGVTGIPQVYSTPVFFAPDQRPNVLADPILAPRPDRYWRRQVAAVLAGRPADWDRDRLQALLPVRVLDQYLNTAEDLDRMLHRRSGRASQAWRECTAVRLNLASGELGWYSAVPRKEGASELLWQVYARAEAAFRGAREYRAARICRRLNRLGG